MGVMRVEQEVPIVMLSEFAAQGPVRHIASEASLAALHEQRIYLKSLVAA